MNRYQRRRAAAIGRQKETRQRHIIRRWIARGLDQQQVHSKIKTAQEMEQYPWI